MVCETLQVISAPKELRFYRKERVSKEWAPGLSNVRNLGDRGSTTNGKEEPL